MGYITNAERIGRAEGLREGRTEGRVEGLVEGIGAMLEIKFGQAGVALMPEIQGINEIAKLEQLVQAIKRATTLEEVRAVYQAPQA